MARGFEINKRGIDRMMKELQREIDKRPIKIPVQAPRPSPSHFPAGTDDLGLDGQQSGDVHYHLGTVVYVSGDRAQVAWGNNVVSQQQGSSAEVTAGFEELARILGEVLEKLPAIGLEQDDHAEAEATAQEMLVEVTTAQPDQSKIRRELQRLKGILAPVVAGAAEGGGSEVAKLLINLMGKAFS